MNSSGKSRGEVERRKLNWGVNDKQTTFNPLFQRPIDDRHVINTSAATGIR